ncbi:VOC family protein [Aquabacterium sp. A7-Y]|uniref:VOC family protein n=1 Tax=Aquabacterium sp. A7-Y TaxID=1349605 RepID=UPI00223D16CD|nr:VOC family protein [Aquabacterium sp. A7-Y]MCW7538177.1 VOC family protein [Aquabacterium sp. A7-Y]
MSQPVKPIPDGYTAVTPYLTIRGAAGAIEFYKKAFGAVETLRMPSPDGLISHAEITINGAIVMLHDETDQWPARSPTTIGDSGTTLMLYVDDVDVVMQRAVDAGATVTMPAANQFYGDRCGKITDPYGHKWSIATHIEDVSPEEISRRAAQLFASGV